MGTDRMALVVNFNEAHHLAPCLDRLRPLGRLVVADLGSTDNSRQVAEDAGAEFWPIERQPVVERVLADLVPSLDAAWVLRVDPDELVPAALMANIGRAIDSAPDSVGAFSLPRQYYFKGRALRGTVWGGVKPVPTRLFRPKALIPVGQVHGEDQLHEGFTAAAVEGEPLQHMWADSYRVLLRKHRRYLDAEGAAMSSRGQRWSALAAARGLAGALVASLRTLSPGDGLTGVLLGGVFVHYAGARWLALRRHDLLVHGEKFPT